MPSLPYMATISTQMAEAIVESPILERSLRLSELFSKEPVQPLREIRDSGFDAIVQISNTAMLAALNRSLSGISRARRLEASIPNNLESSLAEELAARVASERIEAEIIAYPIMTRENVEVELEPSGLEARVALSSVNISKGVFPVVSARFAVTLSVTATETANSYNNRVDSSSFRSAPPPFRYQLPVGSEPVTRVIPIDSISIEVSSHIRIQADTSQFRILAQINFNTSDITVSRTSPWGEVTLDIVTPLLRSFGNHNLIPPIQFFGDPPVLPISGVSRFDVMTVGLPSNLPGGSLLAFCIQFMAGTSAPDISMVGSFIGQGNFAFFATEPIILGTIMSRWRSLPNRVLEWNLPLRFANEDGISQEATALIQYELGDAHWSRLSYGTEFISDNILVNATFRSRAISAQFRGEDISDELGDLANSRESRKIFRLFPDYSPVKQKSEILDNWLLGIGKHLLSPLLRPISSGWQIRGDFEVQVSTPLAAILTRGIIV